MSKDDEKQLGISEVQTDESPQPYGRSIFSLASSGAKSLRSENSSLTHGLTPEVFAKGDKPAKSAQGRILSGKARWLYPTTALGGALLLSAGSAFQTSPDVQALPQTPDHPVSNPVSRTPTPTPKIIDYRTGGEWNPIGGIDYFPLISRRDNLQSLADTATYPTDAPTYPSQCNNNLHPAGLNDIPIIKIRVVVAPIKFPDEVPGGQLVDSGVINTSGPQSLQDLTFYTHFFGVQITTEAISGSITAPHNYSYYKGKGPSGLDNIMADVRSDIYQKITPDPNSYLSIWDTYSLNDGTEDAFPPQGWNLTDHGETLINQKTVLTPSLLNSLIKIHEGGHQIFRWVHAYDEIDDIENDSTLANGNSKYVTKKEADSVCGGLVRPTATPTNTPVRLLTATPVPAETSHPSSNPTPTLTPTSRVYKVNLPIVMRQPVTNPR